MATSHDRLRRAGRARARGRRARAGREAGRRIGVARGRRGSRRPPSAAGTRGQGRLQPPLPSRHRARGAEVARSGRYGDVLHLRGRYGHGGRLGYDREWRADPARSGGGELIDQGMHLLDLIALARSARCRCTRRCCAPSSGTRRSRTTRRCCSATARDRTRAVGDAARELDRVEEPLLARDLLPHRRSCRSTAWCAPTGRSGCGSTAMKPELGPPDIEELAYRAEDGSWAREWDALRATRSPRATPRRLRGDLADARYAWETVEAAYAGRRLRRDAGAGRRMSGRVLVTGGSTGIGLGAARPSWRAADTALTLVARTRADAGGGRGVAARRRPPRRWPSTSATRAPGTRSRSSSPSSTGWSPRPACSGRSAPSAATTRAAFADAVQINLLGTLLAIHHCLPALRAARGAIVTFSGGGATGPLAALRRLRGSKAAVVRLTENLAAELAADGVRVNAWPPASSPRACTTPRWPPGAEAARRGRTSSGRGATSTPVASRRARGRAGRAACSPRRATGIHRQADLGAVGPVAGPGVPRAPARRARPRDPPPHRRRLLHGGGEVTALTALRPPPGLDAVPSSSAVGASMAPPSRSLAYEQVADAQLVCRARGAARGEQPRPLHRRAHAPGAAARHPRPRCGPARSSSTSAARPATCSKTCAASIPAPSPSASTSSPRVCAGRTPSVPDAPLLLADCLRPAAARRERRRDRVRQRARARGRRRAARCARCAACCAPAALAAVVVPAGPGLYDYYDQLLGHERRYARRELARRGERAGLEVRDDAYLGSLAVPAVLGGQEAQPPPPSRARPTRSARRSSSARSPAPRARGWATPLARSSATLSRAASASPSASAPSPSSGGPHESMSCSRSSFPPTTRRRTSSALYRPRERGARADRAWTGRSIFTVDPCTGSHRGADPRAARARPAREDAALLAPLRPAGGDAGRAGGGDRRRRGRDRLRPAGSARADRRDGRALARGLRRRLRASAARARARRCRSGSSPRVGYRVIKRIADVEIPPNTGDFRLMSRRVVDHVVALDEAHGFLRGLVAARRLPPDGGALRPRPARRGGEQVQPLHRARW